MDKLNNTDAIDYLLRERSSLWLEIGKIKAQLSVLSQKALDTSLQQEDHATSLNRLEENVTRLESVNSSLGIPQITIPLSDVTTNQQASHQHSLNTTTTCAHTNLLQFELKSGYSSVSECDACNNGFTEYLLFLYQVGKEDPILTFRLCGKCVYDNKEVLRSPIIKQHKEVKSHGE